jgi:hypothetical protein
MTTYASKRFDEPAKCFNLAPDYLAFCIPHYFADKPESFCLVSDDPADARRDDEPPPLKRGK